MRILACLLVCKTVILVLLSYPGYFPPNFRTDFLLGREAYFFGPYQGAFYVHILSGPFSLLAGLVLLSESFRLRVPKWHRYLGRVQVVTILAFVTPSGLWMSWHAATGTVAATGFATLAIATAICAGLGWRTAVQRRFEIHRRWMQRCFVLLCSAVVLRIAGGLSEILVIEGTYPYTAWLSWLLPLLVLEATRYPRNLTNKKGTAAGRR